MEGDVTVRVTHSTVDYKDGLAITSKAPVVRRWPMVPGIDFAGVVETSSNPEFKPGDAVILNGWGLGETHLGGYAQYARVKGGWLVPLPAGLTPAQAMAIGTAGYTAMLSVMALEALGVTPAKGPVIVTGAAGGVGSVAIALLSKLGYTVIASTGRSEEEPYLRYLGGFRIDRAARTLGARKAARPRTLGGRGRRRRQPHAGECAGADEIWRSGRRLRVGPRNGPADKRGALYPSRRNSHRHQFRHGPESETPRGMVAARQRPRSEQARRHDAHRNWKKVEGLAQRIIEGKVRGRIVLEMHE